MPRHSTDKARRLMQAEIALHDYAHDIEGEDAVVDLLTDLMHFCAHHGYSVEAVIARARGHYDAEARA